MNDQRRRERPHLRLVYSVTEEERRKNLIECPLCGGEELVEYMDDHEVCSRCENKNAA